MFRRKPKKVVIPIVARRRFGEPLPRPPLRITPREWLIGVAAFVATFIGGWVYSAGTVPGWSRVQSAYASIPYRNCDAAHAAGAAPIYRGQPGYGPKLDADGDGVACEPYSGGSNSHRRHRS